MKKVNYIIFGSISLALFLGVLFIGCKKQSTLVVAPPQVHFTGADIQTYTIATNPAPSYKVTVGTTDVSTSDRTVTFSVSSPTGAAAGTQYNLSGVTGNTIVIPAGKATADIVVNGVYAQYTGGRKDTLIFTLSSPSVDLATFSTKVKVFLRGPCFDGEIVFSQLLGSYTKTFENGSYGPYTTTIGTMTALTATTAKANITNIYDSGITGVATFDWTTVGNFTVTIAAQQVGTLSGAPLFLRTTAPGKFTYCVAAFTLPLELYTTAGGTYDAWIMTMAR